MVFTLFEFHFTNLKVKIIDKLGLSYHSVKELNDVIDKLPRWPSFQCSKLIIGDEELEFYSRDVLECIQSLYGNPNFTHDMAFVPE
jgi:Plavaka transposase